MEDQKKKNLHWNLVMMVVRRYWRQKRKGVCGLINDVAIYYKT